MVGDEDADSLLFQVKNDLADVVDGERLGFIWMARG